MIECSFKPRINSGSPTRKAKRSANGYFESIQRMKTAQLEKVNRQQNIEDMGRPKLGAQCFTQDGLTNVQPFSFESRPAQMKIKDQKRNNAEQSSKTLKSSSKKFQSFTQSQKTLTPYKSTGIPSALSLKKASKRAQATVQEKNKLFDVEVVIAPGKVVRIKIMQDDDPADVARVFQKQYDLNDEATNQLQELLQNNYNREMESLN